MNPFTSVRNALITAFILAIAIAIVLTQVGLGNAIAFNHAIAARWLHILAGVMWIGLLYYFNVVQTPGMADAAADKGGPGGAGINKYIAPRALWWFRWAAVLTWLTGAYYLQTGPGYDHDFLNAFLLRPSYEVIGLGSWLGTIILFNVWALIWPNQKKILGIVPATDEEKAAARRTAFLASRSNTALSIPMLFFMIASGGLFRTAFF